MLTDKEKLIMASFVPSNAFQLLKKIVQERIRAIDLESTEQENQFKTILKVGEKKGRQSELNELIKILENYYRKSKE